jgi:membrane protein YdbS with pleckstrin-like domain
MDNFDLTLEKDEQVIYKTKLHWIFYKTSFFSLVFGMFVLAALNFVDFFAGTILFGISVRTILQLFVFIFVSIGVIDSYLNYQSSFYMITTRRVIICSGWIVKNMRDILLSRIEGVEVRQTISGRIFNFGSIIIYGMGTCIDRLPLLPDPFGFRGKVQEQMSSVDTRF